MKEHVQTTGIRKWAGEDLIELQSESLSALQQSFAEYGNCVIAGCHVEKVGAQYNITPGIVGLIGVDVSGVEAYKMLQFQGQKNVVLPAFFVMESVVNEREYADGAVKPISYTYRAVLNNVEPTGEYLRIDASGAKTYKDAVGISSKLEKDGSGDAVTATFTTPTTRSNITSGSTLRILFGTIRKWFSDLKALAFKDKVAKSDLDASLTTEFNNKVDKITGKALSTNDYTTAEKTKLRDIAAGAEVNVQADWAEGNTAADAYIKNKPTALPASGGNADTVGGKSPSAFEPAFTKGTAFNKNFGTTAGTVCQGNDSRLTNARTPSGTAGGDLTGTYPNPTIKEGVVLKGNPTITGNLRLKGEGTNHGNKLNFGDGEYVYLHENADDKLTIKANEVTFNTPNVIATKFSGSLTGNASSASKLDVSRAINNVAFDGTRDINISAPPSGTAGGDLAGSYPNPTIKSGVTLSGDPKTSTPNMLDNSTRIATTAFVKTCIDNRSTGFFGKTVNPVVYRINRTNGSRPQLYFNGYDQIWYDISDTTWSAIADIHGVAIDRLQYLVLDNRKGTKETSMGDVDQGIFMEDGENTLSANWDWYGQKQPSAFVTDDMVLPGQISIWEFYATRLPFETHGILFQRCVAKYWC